MTNSYSASQSLDGLVSAIYSGLTRETPWAEALEGLRAATNSNVACLRISVKGAHPSEHLFAAGPKACPQAILEWEARSAGELLPITLRLGEPQIIDWSEFPSFNSVPELLARYDIGSTAVVQIAVEGGAEYVLNLSRSRSAPKYGSDELALLSKVGTHFGRALKLRQEFLRARVVSELQSDTLDRLGIASILIGSKGDISVLNKTAREMLNKSEWLRVRGGRLQAVYEKDNRLFQSILRESLTSRTCGQSRAMLIRHANGGRQLNLLTSVRRTVSLVTGEEETCVILFVGRAVVADDADLKVLQELFSFTPAEAKLALGLAKGMPLGAVESELKIRHNTARAHLRSMFVKADVSKQSELVHRLAYSLAPLGRPTEATMAPSSTIN